MLEARQNWHKFRKLIGNVPPAKNGVIVLHSGNSVLAGSIASANPKTSKHFEDQGMAMEHPDSAWELLAHKYQASSVSFIEREALLGMLAELQRTKMPYPRQLDELRQQILTPSAPRSRLVQHFGERPTEQAWPRKHFFLQFFRPLFAELLPERKILLLVVQYPDPRRLETIAIEFAGKEIRNFIEPDWTGLELDGLDIFHRDSAKRMVLWCENHYLLPTFGSFVTEHVWEEALSLYMRQGARSTWRYLNRQRSQREQDKDFLLEPEPWPLKACMQWLGFRA